jgi:hypothetical protein
MTKAKATKETKQPAPKATKQTKPPAEIDVLEVTRGRIEFCVLGTSPLIPNRLSEKVRRELLLPRKKTAADRAANLKHNPPEEYRASCYTSAGDGPPTRILFPAVAFKSALASVALDIPGAVKAQIGRLTWVVGDYVHIYGVPKLYMAPVRNSDINRTPDIRTRAILPQWAARIAITYVKPLMHQQAVANLLAAAGIMRGVGDGRAEKGKFNFGQFELVSANDPRFCAIVAEGGREAQDKALADPEPYDLESAELLTWFSDELVRRRGRNGGVSDAEDDEDGGEPLQPAAFS